MRNMMMEIDNSRINDIIKDMSRTRHYCGILIRVEGVYDGYNGGVRK